MTSTTCPQHPEQSLAACERCGDFLCRQCQPQNGLCIDCQRRASSWPPLWRLMLAALGVSVVLALVFLGAEFLRDGYVLSPFIAGFYFLTIGLCTTLAVSVIERTRRPSLLNGFSHTPGSAFFMSLVVAILQNARDFVNFPGAPKSAISLLVIAVFTTLIFMVSLRFLRGEQEVAPGFAVWLELGLASVFFGVVSSVLAMAPVGVPVSDPTPSPVHIYCAVMGAFVGCQVVFLSLAFFRKPSDDSLSG